MPCIDAQDACHEEILIALSHKYPDLAAQDHGDFVRLSPAQPACDVVKVWCDYRVLEKDRIQSGSDRYRYTFSHTTRQQEYVGPFSHPTEEGCWIAARRYFIDAGMILVPEDNSHLSSITAEYVQQAQSARCANTLLPLVGDIIIDQSGTMRRLSNVYSDEKVQAATALERSYFLHSNGTSSFSGSCGHVIPQTELCWVEAQERVRFWAFKDNRSGPGRGVDVFVDVAVWRWSGSFEGTL